jgi:nitrogen fixation/metabolism regulation signal transduction histidine kinase
MAQYTKSALEEELKRPDSLPVGWPWRLLLFMAIVFCTMAALYLGMTLGYKPYLNSQINSLDQKISQLSQSIDEEQQKSLISFYSQLININNLLKTHSESSKFFDFLEKNTSGRVYYESADLSVSGKTVKLEGIAASYSVLAEQIEIFRRASEVEGVFLDGSSVGQSGIDFSATLSLNPIIFE